MLLTKRLEIILNTKLPASIPPPPEKIQKMKKGEQDIKLCDI